jgi:nitrogenase molybdenum-cofactor synthesis protein NifE
MISKNRGNLKSLASAYGAMPAHGLTGVNGKIAGALMAVNSIVDAVPLIHGPIGCAFQRKINPFRPYFPFYETPCTNMKDIDVVYGGEDKLETGIKETYKKYRPNLIVVITTCASDLIGCDFRSVIENVMEDVGCEVIYTTGDSVGKRMSVGHQDTLYSITDQLLCNNIEEIEKIDGSVNLITYPIHGAGIKTADMESILDEIGITINKVCFSHTTIGDMHDLPKAELNITDHPMVWTTLMEERLGVAQYTTSAWDEFMKNRDSELLNRSGIEGSAKVFMEIAQILSKEGEAEEVIERRKRDAIERFSKAKAGLEGKRVVGVDVIRGSLGQMLLQDIGMKASVLTFNTHNFERRLTHAAIDEMIDMSIESVRAYGSDPEILMNPTIEEEINAIKRTETDLVISSGANAHKYNKEGIKTFDSMDFMFFHQRIGFESLIELAWMLREVLEKPVRKRNPLLSMLDFDQHRTNLTPNMSKLANIYGIIKGGTVVDGYTYGGRYIAKPAE